MIISQILFWTSLLLIVHSYLFFPWILQLLALNKKENNKIFSREELPKITVLMSVYNEEKIIARKLDSILASDYPENKISIVVGSDASSDKTNAILKKYEEKHPTIKARIFEERKGKPAVINQLVDETEDAIIVMTDAKVIFHKDTLAVLTKHFKNETIGIVGGNIINEKVQKDGVSIQEKAFMSREILMKYREGIIWGSAIGVYGAIYAIRKELYTKVPAGNPVDDFYISMNVLRKKHKAIMDLNAITYHGVPNLITEEYRRKVRIATGNYQNMGFFSNELFSPWKGSSFAYISHKVIRWTGPFIIFLLLFSNILLYNYHLLYDYSLYFLLGLLVLPIIDLFLSKIGIHIVFLRFIRHFLSMNIALLHGFFNHIRGVKQDVWQPTKR